MRNRRYSKVLSFFACGICLLSFLLLIMGAAGFETQAGDQTRPATRLSAVTWEAPDGAQAVTLPRSFQPLPPRTPVTLTTEFTPQSGDFLYLKSVYAPLKVYANDALIYEYGQPGSYPAFLQDPATGVAMVPLPDTSRSITLRMEYLSPVSRNVLTIHPAMLGSESAILNNLVLTLGAPFGFSLIQMFMGVLLLLVALCVAFFERKGFAFLWLGLFSFLSGLWAFGECNLSGLILPNPTLLYLFAFFGLFLMPIPLFYFGLAVVDFHDRRPLLSIAYAMTGVAAVSLLLQLLGLVALSKTMYLFQILLMVSLVLFAAIILYEGVRYKNQAAKRFFLPIFAIAMFCVLEWVNYQIRFTNIISILFQIGVMIFVLVTGVIGGLLVRDALRVARQKQQLDFEVSLMETQMAEQKKQYALFLENAQAVKAQRHDLRHQLAVIRSYSVNGDTGKLTDYLDTLIGSIPDRQGEEYCDNPAVNAIVSHYAALAEKSGIKLSVNLTVPKQTERISDTSLCVMFGNLLENALEACERMTEGDKFIRVYSRLQSNLLTITVDNSFDGAIRKQGGRWLSGKRADFGTGTASVTNVAEQHGGGADFAVNGSVFQASVYVSV